MKLRARYVWISAAVLFVLVASGALYVFVISDSAHYKLFHDETSFNAVLSQQIEPGHSIEHVQSQLGKGVPMPEPERLNTIAAMRNFSEEDPENLPDGVDNGDVIIRYPVEAVHVLLQFRDGRIVNFNPKHWETPMTINLVGFEN